jgi:antitoxin component YwqK of YwqJK toxin-antitoxin module
LDGGMKKLLAAMFVALLMTGWGEETHSSPPLTEEKAKSVAERLGLKDYKIILNAIDSREKTDDYTGWAKFMNDNGQIKGLVQLKDGKPDGPLTQWYENGQKKSVVNWKDGKQDGLSTGWHENGQKWKEGTNKNGKEGGLWTTWYQNGQKNSVVNWKDGKPDGLMTRWYEDGQKSVEVNWKAGKQDGLSTGWYEDGQKQGEGNYKGGKQDGLSKRWYPSGQKENEKNWKDGKQDGLWTEWYLLENTRDILENLLSRSQTREAVILQEMTKYKRDEGLPFVEDTRLDNSSRKRRYIQEITNAKVEKVRINSLLRQIIQIQASINSRPENTGDSKDVDPNINAVKEYLKIDAIKNFGRIPALREKLFELEQVEGKLSRRTPLTKKQDIREVTASIEDVHRILQLEVKASIEDLKNKYHQLEAHEEEFASALDKVQSESVALSEMETKLSGLNRTLEIQRETTDKIQRRIQNLMIQIALSKEQKKAEGFFKDGKKDGFWIFWDENGQKEAQRNYENGRPVPVSPYEKEQSSENGQKKGKEDFLFEEKFPVASPI